MCEEVDEVEVFESFGGDLSVTYPDRKLESKRLGDRPDKVPMGCMYSRKIVRIGFF